MTCKTCIFAVEGERDPRQIGAPVPLLCKRFPPSGGLMMTQQGPVAYSCSVNVKPDDFCFEYQLKVVTQ